MKKRIVSLVLTFSILLSVIPLNVLTALAQDPILYGDADGSGTVDMSDVNLMEQYIEGDEEAKTSIHFTEADVNVDGALNSDDVTLVKECLAGNIQLTDDLCTVSFDTNGGGEVAPIKVGRNYTIMQEIPSPGKEGEVFVGWQKADGSDFYQTEPVTEDMTLQAVYEPMEPAEQVYIDSFALTDQKTDLEIGITAPDKTADQVKEAVTLLTKDGSDPVDLVVADNGGGSFTVRADGGFRAGGTYEMTLGDGLTFTDRDARYRTVALTFAKQEEDNIEFDPDVVFIQDTDDYSYYLDVPGSVDEEFVPVLDIPIYADGSAEVTTGRMNINTNPIPDDIPAFDTYLEAGDIVCVYENVDPRQRDYTQDLYEDDSIAYIRVTAVSVPWAFQFESLSEEDMDEVVFMPDTIPYKVDVLPAGGAGTAGTVDVNGYDHIARASLGMTEAPEFNTGDLLAFYTQDFAGLTEDSPVVYAKVTGIEADELTVNYEIIDKADIEDLTGGLFVSTPITLDDIETEELQASVTAALEDSSFTDEATSILATGALQTPSIQGQLLDMGVSQAEIDAMAAQPLAAAAGGGGRTKFLVEDVRVTPSVLVHDRYEDGYGMGLDVSAVFSVSKKVGSGQTTSLKIEVSAYFEQQGAFGLNVDVDTDWKVYVIIPVLKEVTCSVSIDIKSYSNISLSAKTYTVSEQKRESFDEFIEFVRNGEYADALRELNDLRVQRKLGGGQDVIDQIDSILNSLPKINVGGTEYSFEELENELNMTDVSSEFEEVLSAESAEDSKVGIEQLMNRYSELLNSESDWVQLFSKELFSKTYHIKILAIKLKVDFIVRADVNLTMGTDLEYEVGKRYNFWVKIFSGTSGSSETDLLDERFGFQFYIMGYIGVKAGFKIDVAVGILSTSIASVGANVEFGPYVKLYGYFLYIYIKERPAGTSDWNVEERAEGAMYMEFGLYLTVKFKAQALKELIKYEPTLYDGEFPLLTAGDRNSVYDFALSPTSTDILYILDENGDFADGITMELPEAYRNMKTIDLTSGQKAQSVYDLSNYHIRFTDPAFSIDQNGTISFDKSQIGADDRYAYTDMIVTWKGGKLAFSAYDLSITVPVVWTSYSESEISKLYNVYVAVGNETYGYETVWSGQYNRIQTFDLPTEEEIHDLIGYDAYVTEDGTNLKYTDAGSYRAEKTTELTVSADTTFYYDIGLKTYSLHVKNIQGKDGIPYASTYTTTYGEPFVQLASLEDTGADDPDNGKFSAFLNLTREENDDEVFALDTAADMSFYENYGTSADLSANYTDASRLATFTFQGISVPDYTVTFRTGAAPQAGDLMAHIAQYFDGQVSITDISPAVTASENSVTYSVTCQALTEDTPVYPVNFTVKPSEHQSPEDMPQIASVSYPENSILFAPKLPTLYGAYLDGWYTDEACTKPFDFSSARMPAGGMTLYARYISTQVEVHIMQNAATELETRLVLNGSELGELPKISGMTSTQRLVGWFDNIEYTGDPYTADTIIRSDTDIYLYPYIGEKLEIGVTADLFTPYEKDYNRYPALLKMPEIFSSADFYRKGFYTQDVQVLVREQGAAVTEEWTEVEDPYLLYSDGWPVHAGVYDVRIVWPGNENYKPVDLYLEGYIRINKAPFPTTDGAPLSIPVLQGGYDSVSVSLPKNFDRYSFTEDNQVTIKLRYMQENMNFADYATYTMPIFDGQYMTHSKYLYTCTFDRDELVNPADGLKFGGTLLVSACLEISDGSDYYGTTTGYGLGGLLYPTIDMMNSSARTAQAASPQAVQLSAQTVSAQTTQAASPLNNEAEPIDDGSLRLTGEDVKTMAGKTFGITLSLDNLDSSAGVWGLMAQLDYDGAPFEMIGYSAGSAFPKEGFTMHDDWSADPYRFVVSNTTRTDITSEEAVITIWYRVKDDAQPGHYPVTVALPDAVKAAGEKVPSQSTEIDVWVATDGEFTAQDPEIKLTAEDDYVYTKGNTADMVYVNGSVSDGGTLSYQWYVYTDSQENSTPVNGATAPQFTPPTDTAGIFYYYCRVTNTLSTIAGEKTAYTDTDSVRVEILEEESLVLLDGNRGTFGGGVSGKGLFTKNGRLPDLGQYIPTREMHEFIGWYTQEEGGQRVDSDAVFREDTTLYAHWAATGELTHAQAPEITWVTKSVKTEVNDISNGLYVEADSPDGGRLSYQWYRSDTASNENGTLIENAEYYRYAPDTSQEGIVYYYCVVTNTNTSVTGNWTATTKTEAIPVYTGTVYVTLDAQGGSVNPDKVPLAITRASTGEIGIDGYLPIPEKEGYAFMGWYTEPEGGRQMTQYDAFENATTLYAQWSPDAITPVIADQPDNVDDQMINTEIFLPMTVLTPTDGGTLSYQWYRCKEDGTGAQPVEGATEETFMGVADETGSFYYYCVVTNTNKNVSGSQTASVRSDIARVTVVAPTGVADAMAPWPNWAVLNDATYGKGAQVDDLVYSAFVGDGGLLTYQWYVSSGETSAGTAIDGATQSTFTPPTDEAGTFYYYCVATNTNEYASNNKTAHTVSGRAKITVVDAEAPVITAQPASATYREGDTAVPLTVEVEAPEGCSLTYQWYEGYIEDGAAVAGADQNSFVPAVQMEPDEDYMSIYNYFCAITAAYPDGKTLTLYSQTASITVIDPSSGEYVITFDPNGGSVSEISMSTVNQLLLYMPVPERMGYDFDGWYTEKEGGTHVTVDNRIYSGDETLYAHWVDNGRPVYAQSPVITAQPENAQYFAGDPAAPLTVKADVTDGGTLSYQWYQSADGSTTGGIQVGTNSPSFTPDTSAEGTYYYYCVITNTNDTAYNPTATAKTEAACIKVTAKTHTHTPIPVAGRDATCTEAGSKAYYTCGCGMSFEDEDCTRAIADVDTWRIIPVLGHSFGEWERVTEATCTATGQEKRTCSRCGAEETRETEMTAHAWSDSYLGENADPQMHYHVCEVCGARDEGAVHTWNVDAATEQTDKHCTVCGYVAEAQIGHTHQGALVAGKDATCTEAGSKAYYTCGCGMFFADEGCTRAITDVDTWRIIPALGHSFGEWERVTEATCTATGQEKRTCSRCGAEETRETEITEHAWSDSYLGENADPQMHYHVCQVCGERDEGAEHSWNVDAATEQTDKHCTVCGYVAEAQIGHTHQGTLVEGKDATCTEAGSKAYYTCSCGMFFADEGCTSTIVDLHSWKTIPMLEHDFADGKCTVCGAADPDYESAQPSQPTNPGGSKTESPRTGDSSLALWIAVLFVSGGVMALTVKRKKRAG